MGLFTNIIGSLAEHERKVEFLDSLAILLECRESLNGRLPDGFRPDVIRLNTKRNILFIGDAKNTETPKCKDTQLRLLRYLRWLSAYKKSANGLAIFAICFGRGTEAEEWVETVTFLGRELSIGFTSYKIESFAPDLFVASLILN